MFVIDKELLRPNVVYYPRSGPVSFSDDDLEDICRSSKALVASGRLPPVPLEHRDDAKPVKMSHEDRMSELTRHNSGWVQDFYRKPDGSLWARLGIIDPDIAGKIRDGRVKYVSPEITPVLPADGRVHRNVVTHVAITHQPVWAGQTPFRVPEGWAGTDGSVTPRPARLSLLAGTPIRLSLADALPPPEVAQALRFGYRVPGGKDAKGVWVRGAFYPTHVPKKVLAGLDDDEKRELLRKLNARQGRKLPSDFAGLYEPGEAREYESAVQDVPATHLSLHDELPPFRRPHPAGEPALVWEDPVRGETHLVSGHGLLSKLRPEGGQTVPALKVHAKTPYEARGAALMAHLVGGSAHPEDLAQLFMDGADPGELRAALHEGGHSPNEPLFHRAEYLAGLREDDPDGPPAAGPKEASPGGPSLFSHAEGYDPDEHRWQHWLQSHFPDPARRAAFAAAHGKERPATHADFVARKDAYTQRFSSGGDPVDYFEMTKPKDEEKPEEKGEGKKEAPKEGGEKKDFPPKKGGEGPAPKESKKVKHFEENLAMLKEDFNVDMPKDTDEGNFQEKLHTALTALKHAGKAGGGGVEMGGGAGGGATLEPETGPMMMSLRQDNEALKKALLEKDAEVAGLVDFATSSVFSLIEKDTEALVASGRCTKATRDGWVAKIKETSDRQRFSLLRPRQSAEMAEVFAEIRVSKSLPEGTFLARKAEAPPALGPMEALFSNGPSGGNGAGRMSLVAEENKEKAGTPPAELPFAADAGKKAEFDATWKAIRLSLGIKE